MISALPNRLTQTSAKRELQTQLSSRAPLPHVRSTPKTSKLRTDWWMAAESHAAAAALFGSAAALADAARWSAEENSMREENITLKRRGQEQRDLLEQLDQKKAALGEWGAASCRP